MNQASIFDIPPQDEIADLPVAVSKPKAIDFAGFKIGDRVSGLTKFKTLRGEIIGFKTYGDIPFAHLALDFCGSLIMYDSPVCNLHLLERLPDKLPLQSGELQSGDRVEVVEHQFVSKKIGIIARTEGNLCVVDFGKGNNIWAIAPRRLKKV